MSRDGRRHVARIAETFSGLSRSGDLPLGNQVDPLDELLYIIVTTMTQYGALEGYSRLKAEFPDWNLLSEDDAEPKIRTALRLCGLVNQKTVQILGIAKQLKADFGSVTLAALGPMSDEDCENYLLSLPRVGKKVARCVMMYSLGRDVLPVDAHVLRLAKRLQLLPYDMSWAKAHDAIHEVTPPEDRYQIHVGLVEHGRAVCTHNKPRCAQCLLREQKLCAGDPAN
ncbi:MAG: hypothetical protein WEB00_09910 [Dehalococcoidia bacterium]